MKEHIFGVEDPIIVIRLFAIQRGKREVVASVLSVDALLAVSRLLVNESLYAFDATSDRYWVAINGALL